MKRVLTIIISVILLASGIQISLDRHFCGGNLVDVKISVTGKLASCGMEKTEASCPGYPAVREKCCEDQISFYSLNGNYYPEYITLTHPFSHRDILPVHAVNQTSCKSFNTDLITRVLPPGDDRKSGLTQPGICVFRI